MIVSKIKLRNMKKTTESAEENLNLCVLKKNFQMGLFAGRMMEYYAPITEKQGNDRMSEMKLEIYRN